MRYPPKKISYGLKINNSSGQIGTVIIFLFLAFFCIFIGKFAVLQSPILVLGLVGGLIISLITLVNTDLALIILIFSMFLSPEIPIAQVPERAVVIRIDDILLIFMFFAWFAKMAINKQLGLLKNTPINRYLIIYILICIVSTALSIFFRIGYARFSNAFFYILKYTEYFLIFFLVSNNLRSSRQAKIFTYFLILVCFIVCIYGYYQIKMGLGRVSAPFEGEKTEPNTLAGYLLIMFGLIGGLLLSNQSAISKFILGGLYLFMIPVFLFTLSRGGYLGFLALFASQIILAKRKKLFLLFILIVAILIVPRILPLRVAERVKSTFVPGIQYELLGQKVTLDESAAARVGTWGWVLTDWQKSPLFGYGITGLGFIDGQYVHVIGELGLVGFLVFLWLIFSLFINTLKIYRSSEDTYIQGISLGFLLGFIGILIQGFSANTFIIVRIMEPFWFLAAMVSVLPELAVSRPSELEGT